MDNDWIKDYRKSIEWGWYKDVPTCHLFFHLLRRVNWKHGKFKTRDVLPGEIITGRKQLAFETGLTEQQIRTCLDKLKSTNDITIETTNSFSHIKVQNWCKYQQDIPSKLTNQQPTDNQRITTIEEGNKEIRKEDTNIPPVVLSEILSFFNTTCNTNLRLTETKKKQITQRLKLFTIDEIKLAIKNRMLSKWHIENGWTTDWDSLFRDDEKIDKLLQNKKNNNLSHFNI